MATRQAGDTALAMVHKAVSGRRPPQWTPDAAVLARMFKVEHKLDIWHRARKIQSKLLANKLAQKAAHRDLGEWAPEARDHFWRASQHCDGDTLLFKVEKENITD